jgi:anaerobic selenocysteine-containing dehydrogenase/ferredoxin-NADP reductase
MTRTEQKVGYCALCRSRCGAIYTTRGDQLLGVAPDLDHPTGGALCPKGRAAPELAHRPDRLTRPLRRTNPKSDADPGWVEIDWEEALVEVASRLGQIRDESGAEAVAFGVTTPSGTPISDGIDWIERFIRLFGSPNIVYAVELCNWHKDYAHAYTFGCRMPPPDYDGADLILLWGYNPAKVWLAQSSMIAAAKERGAVVAVVDPRRAGSGLQANHWLRVRPGADGALALGLANIMIGEGAYDHGFVRDWTNAPCLVRDDTDRLLRASELDPDLPGDQFVVWSGSGPVPYDTSRPAVGSEDFALHGSRTVRTLAGVVACRPAFERFADICREWTPARAAATTWVPEQRIRALADALRSARSVAYHSWTGVGQHTNATQTERALAVLYALTGSFDAPGGNVVLPAHEVNPPTSLEQLPEAQRRKALGAPERPLGPPAQGWITARDLYASILEHKPYRVRGLMAFGGNMLVSQPDGQRGREALQELEFYVHCDVSQNPTSELADIVLPVNTPWEREALRVGFEITHEAQELVQLRQRIVPPLGESRSDTEIVFDLAPRLGLGKRFFDGDIEAAWNHVTAPLGLTMAELRRRPEGVRLPLTMTYRKHAQPSATGVRGFDTETRRVEMYSELFVRHGHDGVPRFIEPTASPIGADANPRFPLVLTSAKSGRFCHTEHRAVSSLRARSPDPSIDLSPALAAERGIEAGDWVVVSTRHARIRLRARIDESLHPRVVVGEYGWWEAAPDLGLPGYDPFDHEGSNFNLLIGREHWDPVSGAAPLRSCACDVARHVPADGRALWGGEKPFTVTEILAETGDAASVTLEPQDASPLPDYRPGQHLALRLEGVPGLEGVSRSYSLTGAAVAPERRGYRITVKRIRRDPFGSSEPSPSMSTHITDALRPGDTVYVRAPDGVFSPATEPAQPVVLIAAGVGITPFMSYLETLAGSDRGAEVVLHHCSRSGAEHIFKRRIAEIADELSGLTVINHYTRPRREDRRGGDYHIEGRIAPEHIAQDLIDGHARFYVCGPLDLIRVLKDGLVARGVPAFHIFHELFASAPAPLVVGPTRSIHFARSKRTLTWDGSSSSLLSLAERAGLALPSGCHVGQCESCAVRVLSGEVHHLLGDLGGIDDGSCLTCQAIPTSDLVLDA